MSDKESMINQDGLVMIKDGRASIIVIDDPIEELVRILDHRERIWSDMTYKQQLEVFRTGQYTGENLTIEVFRSLEIKVDDENFALEKLGDDIIKEVEDAEAEQEEEPWKVEVECVTADSGPNPKKTWLMSPSMTLPQARERGQEEAEKIWGAGREFLIHVV